MSFPQTFLEHMSHFASSGPPLFSLPVSSSRKLAATAPEDQHYGYVPKEAVAIIFLSLYGISTILHIVQAAWFRTWWLLPTAALCGVAELLGWSGRLGSSISPTALTPFLIQISTTIMAPTPLLAANFMILSRIIQRLGASYSLLSPKWYTILFLPCDIIALVVQGVGGGMASSANTLAGANVGANVMLGGIGFQFSANRPTRTDWAPRGVLTPRLKIMLAALAFSTTTLFIRSIYRIIELASGWEGRIIHTERYFDVLDGWMVVLAIVTINVAHPGLLLAPQVPTKAEALELESRESSGEAVVKGRPMLLKVRST
ncbi:RTA1 like protein-domain-containing protein [Mycena galericulata]|nr:RTA1 like protein-domain-containing protein [Mycena galericulata]